MIKRKQIFCVVMALLVLAFSYPLSVPAKAIALDPVTFMYPIWQMIGQAGGVTITTVGGDEFTQSNFPSLFDEWQQSRVSSGLQQAAQSISDWASEMWDYVKVAPSAVSAGVLSTALRLESYVVLPLQQFWNWIITEKLGGSSVDAVDFAQGTGNLVKASSSIGFAIPKYGTSWPTQADVATYGRVVFTDTSTNPYRTFKVLALETSPDIYAYRISTTLTVRFMCLGDYDGLKLSYFVTNANSTSTSSASSMTFSYIADKGVSRTTLSSGDIFPTDLEVFSSDADAYAYFFEAVENPPQGGSITIAPEAGAGALDFPDTDDLDYVPPDMVLPWNIPYDQYMDKSGYLDEAYDKALDNTLADQVISQNPPVEGTGTVGSVGEYVAPGLAEVFPFCIPFDVYNFLEALAAEPQAPSFTAQLAFPDAVGGTRSITIDFDTPEWNAVAQILRTLELLLFIIGLAVVTREKFIRS